MLRLPNATAIALAASMLATAGLAQTQPVTGIVYADKNGNGTRDSGENGVRGVVVSNQIDVATTDSLGRFQLGAAPTGVVFISLPNGYRSVGSFWRAVSASRVTSDRS